MVKDDTTLVRRCLQGDRDAFGLLVKRYEHAAFGLALSYLRDFADAEDVAQEAFVSAYCNLPHLQNPAKFGSWLKTTVVNLCRNTHRSRNAEAASLARMGQERILEGTKAPTPPDQLYELQDLRTRIMKAIGQLSEKNRQAVTMFYIDGLSAEEIGQFLETSTTAINQRLHRARVQLKEEMMDMVEDVLKSSYPKGFPEKVLREIAEQATEAHKQHMHGESVQRYTQALEILDELEETEEQRRWKADMLWERGNATHFLEWKNEEKVIADLEAALALEEGLTNRHKYADHLVQAGVSYSNARKPQKAFDAYQKAASIYESIGNSGGQAQCLYWMATKYIPWFPQERSAVEPDHNQALQHLHRATELFQQAGDAAGEVMSLAASTLLKKIGADPSKEVVESIGTGGGSFVRSAETIHWGTGGGGISRCEGGQDARPVRGIAAYLSKPPELLFFPLNAGEHRSYRTFAYGVEEMYATATVERLNAKVKTPAGTFEQCLEMKTVFERKGEDPSEIYQKLNVQNSGTRRVWFAPGVGVIKLIYQHGDGVETEAQLMDYEGLKSTNDYFPLQVDARWHYRVKNTYSDYAVRDTWWITVQNDNTFYYGHYCYSEKQ